MLIQIPSKYADKIRIISPSNCWMWAGVINVDGYALHAGKSLARKIYKELIGEIPINFHMDHLCRNRACVNPDHLEPVTLEENTKRGAKSRQDGKWNPLEFKRFWVPKRKYERKTKRGVKNG